MVRHENSWYSPCMEREMKIYSYGDYGLPMIFFAPQNGTCYDYEKCGMITQLQDYIDKGKIHVFCVDSCDEDSFSDIHGDKGHRAYIQSQFYYYVTTELLPFVRAESNDKRLPFLAGVSAGANQAAIQFLRRPDLYSGMLALSSVMDMKNYFFEGWCDERLYENLPMEFLPNMVKDHPYISLYNQKRIIFCIGQGAWEEGVNDLKRLEEIFKTKGIRAWFDYWGFDVSHDWYWWYLQMRYFLPFILRDK